jgi:N-acetyl-anhydromuramyl-L-alanine amidase AmpD
MYKVEVSRKGFKPTVIENASAKVPGKDPVGHFVKPNNLVKVKIKKWSDNFAKPSRLVDTVFLHCSASDAPEHDSVDVMTQWHKKRGFSEIGYHFFIKKDGVIQKGRNLEKDPAAQEGYNKGTIAICLHGLDVNKFTTQQFKSLIDLCHAIKDSYNKPIRFRGHKEVAAKACPVFDYKNVLKLNNNGYMSR